MKEETWWKVIAGAGLITLSLTLYTAHFLLFSDARHILIYLIGDLAFIPIEVLIVTVIVDQMLKSREKQQRAEKLNMVIGTFFSTTGMPLLKTLTRADPAIGSLAPRLIIRDHWQNSDFRDLKKILESYACTVDIDRIDIHAMQDFLLHNESFLLRLVENPMIFERESFTDLIFAINHLTEELKARDNLTALPQRDRAHLAIDFKRIYSQLVPEWLKYMEYLKEHYPYLFNLAMRTNPFDTSASVVFGDDA